MSPSKNPLSGEKAKAIIAEFPEASTSMLARMLYERHPKVYPTQDSARTAVRYYRGAQGAQYRAQRGLATNTTPKPARIELPASDGVELAPFVVDGCKRPLILSDIHLPYHTPEAISCALDLGKKRGADCIILNGDTVDFHRVSNFEPDPEARDLKGERAVAVQFLGYLRQEFPQARIIWKDGNHEERLARYVLQKAPEIYDQTILGIPALLHFDRLGIEYVTDKRTIRLGGLSVLHGHELSKGFFAPAHAARTAYTKAHVSLIIGHHHVAGEYTAVDLGGGISTVWSTGCLSILRPRYAPYSQYGHGFADVELDGDQFRVTNHRIHHGSLLN